MAGRRDIGNSTEDPLADLPVITDLRAAESTACGDAGIEEGANSTRVCGKSLSPVVTPAKAPR
jgi:hypothetical protein